MIDYINIGASPVDESCAQVGEPDYYEKSIEECKRFKALLIEKFGEPPEGARLAIKTFQHDFGEYREVVCYFDDSIQKSLEYALKLEGETPLHWEER